MQNIESKIALSGKSYIKTFGQPPYRYVLIVGPGGMGSSNDGVQNILTILEHFKLSSVIIGDGKQSFDVLKELNVLQSTVARGAMVDICCHGGIINSKHYSGFSEQHTPSKAILRKLDRVVDYKRARFPVILVNYHACRTMALSKHVPEGMLAFLYGPCTRPSQTSFNAVAIMRKLTLHAHNRSYFYIIANELVCSAETKTIQYKYTVESFTYTHAPKRNKPLSYDEHMQELSTTLSEYHSKFIKLSKEKSYELCQVDVETSADKMVVTQTISDPAHVISMNMATYERYTAHAAHIAVLEGNVEFFNAKKHVSLNIDPLLLCAIHNGNNQIFQVLITQAELSDKCAANMMELLNSNSTCNKSLILNALCTTRLNRTLASQPLTAIISDHHHHLSLTPQQYEEGYTAAFRFGKYDIAKILYSKC